MNLPSQQPKTKSLPEWKLWVINILPFVWVFVAVIISCLISYQALTPQKNRKLNPSRHYIWENRPQELTGSEFFYLETADDNKLKNSTLSKQ